MSGRRGHIQSANLRAGCAKLRLRHPDLRISRVARCLFRIDFGLGHEAPALKRDCTLVIGLGERRVGAGSIDLRGQLRRLLRLNGAVDNREDLPCADPAAGIDENAHDPSAGARDSDRLIALGGKRAAGGEDSSDLASAGDDHGHGRDLPGTRAGGRRVAFGRAAAEHDRGKDDEQRRKRSADDDPAPARTRTIGHHERVRRVDRGFPVHHSLPSFANPSWLTATVLAK